MKTKDDVRLEFAGEVSYLAKTIVVVLMESAGISF